MAGYSRPAVARIFGVPALGGLLFGWDIGATSYVLTQIQSAEYAGVSWSGAVAGSSFLQGLITSGGVAGALIGAMIVFRIADAIGRREGIDQLLAACLAPATPHAHGALARSDQEERPGGGPVALEEHQRRAARAHQ